VFITPAGTLRGKDGVRQGFTQLLADVPNADWALPTQILRGRRALPGMGPPSPAATRVEDGIDTFVFADGQIRVQTVRYHAAAHELIAGRETHSFGR